MERAQNSKIFVANFNPETSDEELRANFERFGKISYIDRRADKDYLIIEYEDAESSRQAIAEMDAIVINDCKVKVQQAWQHYRKWTFGETINKLLEEGCVKNNASPDDQCFKCGEKGHHQVICPNPYKRRRQYNLQSVQCFNCHEYGHYKNQCPKKE